MLRQLSHRPIRDLRSVCTPLHPAHSELAGGGSVPQRPGQVPQFSILAPLVSRKGAREKNSMRRPSLGAVRVERSGGLRERILGAREGEGFGAWGAPDGHSAARLGGSF